MRVVIHNATVIGEVDLGGAPGYPAHPIAPGGPGVGPGPGYPAHPIAPGGQPPGIWGPPGPWPTPPIAPGGPPPGIWPSPGHPEHPIVLPPDGTPPPDAKLIEWKTAWSPQTGWIIVGVPSEDVEHPTPSAEASE